jgi:integrase
MTGARISEATGVQWGEIDFDKKLWTTPGHRMKMRKAHIAPLSRQAIELLGLAAQGQDRRRRLPEPGRLEANIACAMLAGHQGRDGQRRDQSWFRNHVRSRCAAHGVDRQLADLAIATRSAASRGGTSAIP